MMSGLLLLTIGVVALVFAAYFVFGSDRIAHRNILDQWIDWLPASRRRSRPAPPLADPLEALINRVYAIDEHLVRMKVAMAVVLLAAGSFLLIVSASLWRR